MSRFLRKLLDAAAQRPTHRPHRAETVACPTCGAQPGVRCRSLQTGELLMEPKPIHSGRRSRWRVETGGEPDCGNVSPDGRTSCVLAKGHRHPLRHESVTGKGWDS